MGVKAFSCTEPIPPYAVDALGPAVESLQAPFHVPRSVGDAMNTGWIEAVMRMNECVVAAEERFNRQVICVAEMGRQGSSTMEAETMLRSYRRSLDLLRLIQGQLLSEPERVS